MGNSGELNSAPAAKPGILAIVVCGAVLAGCAHPAPASLHGRTTVISGRGTARESVSDATATVLTEAAAITLDHGYRYFEVSGPVRPGADMTIHVYGAGEIDPGTAGVFDADAVAAGQSVPH